MEKRQVIFLVACLIVLLAWMQIFKPGQPQRDTAPAPTDETQTGEEAAPPEDQQPDSPETPGQNGSEPAETPGITEQTEDTETEPVEDAEAETTEPAEPFEPQIFVLSNPFATFEISSEGGVVRQVTIETKVTSKDHGIVVHGDTPYTFCDDDLPQEMYPLAIFSEDENGLDLANVEFKKVTPDSDDATLVLRYENSRIAVTKTFTLPEKGYRLETKLAIRNKTNDRLKLPEYYIRIGSVHPVDDKDSRPEVRITVDSGSPRKLKPARDGKTPRSEPISVVRWAAISNKYFGVILDGRGLKPTDTGELKTRRLVSEIQFLRYADENKKRKIFATGLKVALPDLSLDAGRERTFDLALYVGPKERSRLRTLGYSKVMGTTFLATLASGLMFVLNFIYGFVPNYGVAIILLTALIKVLLFPLDRRSFKSMREMQKIQPLVKQLQAKYKDDKQQLQIEQMKLFKEHKVNPLGGCLPMLLQFPVLFGMFTMLRNAVELWRAPFFGYVTDLSRPDTLFTIPSVPFIGLLEIHVLPILMTVFTILSQRLRGQATATDPQQKMMTQMMPVIFLFIFYSFPSGLNLYWLCSTVFSFGLQLVVQRRDDKKELKK